MAPAKKPTENDLTSVITAIAVLQNDIENIGKNIDEIKDMIKADYATKAELTALKVEFALVQKIVFGMCGLILIGFFGVIAKLVFGG